MTPRTGTADVHPSTPGAGASSAPARKASAPRAAVIAAPALALLLAAFPARGGVDRWTEIGPAAPADQVAMVASDPLLLYVASGCEVWRSGDAGESWELRGAVPGCEAEPLLLLAAPGRPALLYAAVSEPTQAPWEPALLRSEDGGRTWRRLLTAYILALAAHPEDPSLLFAGGRGLYRSTDGGESWNLVWSPAPGAAGGGSGSPAPGGSIPGGGFGIATDTVTSLYFAPADPSAVYANVQHYLTGSVYDTCYVSRDAGESWQAPPGDWCGDAQFDWIPGLRTRPDMCKVQWPFAIVCRSGDVEPTPEVAPAPGDALVVVPSEPPVLYAGDHQAGQVFRSLDGGRSWSPFAVWDELIPSVPSILWPPPWMFIHPAAPERVYAAAGRLRRATFVEAEPLRSPDGRFETRAAWRRRGRAAAALPVPLGDGEGAFWFFRPDNLELGTKLLDARAVNGRFWAFQTALTNLEYELTVADAATGRDRTWFNPAGRFAARADTGTLVDAAAGAPAAEAVEAVRSPGAPAPAGASGAVAPGALDPPASPRPAALPGTTPAACTPSPSTLCLLGRFAVEATWRGPDGDLRPADAVPLTAAAGGFRFGSAGSLQLLVKLLDGRAVNDRFWLFYGGLTDRELELVVTDLRTGQTRIDATVEGELASAGDTDAFPGP